jgi:DnaK suppressor protein
MNDLTHFEHVLTDALSRITRELEAIATHDIESDTWEAKPDMTDGADADENVEADAVEEWNERRSTAEALEIEYRDTKRALAKITDGTFGTCEIGGEQIENERLMIKPTARTCIHHLNEEAQLPL